MAFVSHLNKNREALHTDVAQFVREIESTDTPGETYRIELALQYTDAYQETVYTLRQQHQHARRRDAPCGPSSRG